MKDVSTFLSAGRFAIAGVSRNPKKFGHVVFKTLYNKGIDVLPVNPNDFVFNGVTSYKSVSALPDDVKALIIITQPSETLAVAKEAIAKGINNIWIQPGAESKKVLAELEKENINLITRECILMYCKPKGIHSFHRFLRKISGHLPA